VALELGTLFLNAEGLRYRKITQVRGILLGALTRSLACPSFGVLIG
jgi:hypothetical protein